MDIGFDIGLVYHIDDAHQFWAELEDTLRIPETATLSQIDGRLRLYVSLCATYHQQYLQTQLQLQHACSMLLDSELFAFHSERMSHLLIDEAVANTNPHAQLILHKTLLLYGRAHTAFLRSQAKWAPLIPILMDHVSVTIDFDAFADSKGANAQAVPIEARLMTLAVGILYEVCRVQKFDIAGLRIFSDAFIETLFDLVEETRDLADETLNYTLIKLILALNEQFMVAALPEKEKEKEQQHPANANANANAKSSSAASRNRVLQILVARGASSKTFAENIIFMLNRAGSSEEDFCMQLLVLKILYLLFTTRGTHEYFYTNDLCVLVDVFLRELSDLPDESESLRHTYLRVLSPLLTNTQLRTVPYKRAQIVRTLQALVDHAHIRDVSPTTRRLVQRCLQAEWAASVLQERRGSESSMSSSQQHSPTSPSSMSSFASALPATKSLLGPPALKRDKSLRSSASASDLKSAAAPSHNSHNANLRVATPPHNGSMVSLAVAQPPSPSPAATLGKGAPKAGLLGVRHPQRGVSLGEVADTLRASFGDDAVSFASSSASSSGSPTPPPPERADSLDAPPVRARTTSSPYRKAPPPPPPGVHRRKAPAPPVKAPTSTTAAANGHTISPIARSRARPAVVL